MPSTVIESYNYDADTQILQIHFVTGRVYNYLEVPEEIFNAMKASKSKGIYFNLHIKNKFSFKKK